MSTEKFILKSHPHHDKLYASTTGRIFLELVEKTAQHGYMILRVPIKIGRIIKYKSVRRHTLVAETFHRKPKLDERVVCRHLDGNPGNDNYKNLKWGTQRENAQDTVLHKRTTLGSKNARSKLTLEQAQSIYDRHKAGEFQKTIAKEFGINQVTVSDIVNHRTWPEVKRSGKEKRIIRIRDRRGQYKKKIRPTFHFSPERMALRRKARARLTRYSGHAIKVR